jgi:hypothetical protein
MPQGNDPSDKVIVAVKDSNPKEYDIINLQNNFRKLKDWRFEDGHTRTAAGGQDES